MLHIYSFDRPLLDHRCNDSVGPSGSGAALAGAGSFFSTVGGLVGTIMTNHQNDKQLYRQAAENAAARRWQDLESDPAYVRQRLENAGYNPYLGMSASSPAVPSASSAPIASQFDTGSQLGQVFQNIPSTFATLLNAYSGAKLNDSSIDLNHSNSAKAWQESLNLNYDNWRQKFLDNAKDSYGNTGLQNQVISTSAAARGAAAAADSAAFEAHRAKIFQMLDDEPYVNDKDGYSLVNDDGSPVTNSQVRYYADRDSLVTNVQKILSDIGVANANIDNITCDSEMKRLNIKWLPKKYRTEIDNMIQSQRNDNRVAAATVGNLNAGADSSRASAENTRADTKTKNATRPYVVKDARNTASLHGHQSVTESNRSKTEYWHSVSAKARGAADYQRNAWRFGHGFFNKALIQWDGTTHFFNHSTVLGTHFGIFSKKNPSGTIVDHF